MPRPRWIKHELFEDETLARCRPGARLLFVGLIAWADDHGRLRGASAFLRARVFPYDQDIDDERIEAWLRELDAGGLVTRYDVGGEAYLQLSSWSKHQRAYRNPTAEVPGPLDTGTVLPDIENGSKNGSETVPERLSPGDSPHSASESPFPGLEDLGKQESPPTSKATPTAKTTSTSTAKSVRGSGGENRSRDVEAVWAYWLKRREPHKRQLTTSNRRMIEKGLAEFNVDELCKAIDGLLKSTWHREHGRLYLSSLFRTKPGGDSLADQIARFIDDAGKEGGRDASAYDAAIRNRR